MGTERAARALLPLLLAGIAGAALAQGAGGATGDAVLGRRLYVEGLRPDGQPLVGQRTDGVQVRGAQAACAQCHRASGAGGAEGTVLIPPVAGPLLFAPARADSGHAPRRAAGVRHADTASKVRGAYTLEALQRAVVDGHAPGGAPLGYLMPRYALTAAEIGHLAAHLNTLAIGQADGVDDRHLWLATVVADTAAPAQRQAVADILQRCVAERSPRAGGGDDAAAAPPAIRPWRLDVWTLHGPPESWDAQLAEYARRRPVFALVSGATGEAWAPVQRFCEKTTLPCAFPNTMAVDPQAPGHWTMHLSLGVAAEVAALVEHLSDQAPGGAPPKLQQVVSDSEASRLAARLLRARAAGLGWRVAADEVVGDGSAATPVVGAAAAAGPDRVTVLWLEPEALRLYSTRHPPPAGRAYLSGALGGLDAAPLAPAWRGGAHMLYPYEHADRRVGRTLLNAGGWMQRNGLELTAELLLLQGNTYSACEMTARALHIMRDRYSREYFMELLEGASEGALATAFPRFTLGAHQRFGSRGAYVMRYESTASAGGRTQLNRVSDWLTER